MSISSVGKWSPSQAQTPNIIILTDAAKERMKYLIRKKPGGQAIHFGVKKSGCSGYAYLIEVIESESGYSYYCDLGDNLKLAVDDASAPYIKGTEIDFVREGLNSQFKFKNPNEKASCGCGESFTIEPPTL